MNVQPFGRTLDARKRHVTLPANPDYNAPPLTVECLARLFGHESFNILVASEPKASATHWELYTYAQSGCLAAYLPGYTPAEIVSGAAVADGQWHYCAMTFDGRTVKLYVDGKEVASERLRRRTGVASVAGPLCVGHIAGTTLGCDGELDEVRVSSVIRQTQALPMQPYEDDRDTLALWHFDPVFAGVGASRETDPFRAGADAALQARKALGAAEASAVLVFDRLDGGARSSIRMIEGIGWFFDTSLVFGCSGFGPITRQGSGATVGVLALGEEFTVLSAVADVAGDHRACGRTLATTLRGIQDSRKGPGRLVLLMGDCHVPANDALVQGFSESFGENVPVAGGSCPQDGLLYYKGVVRQSANLALLLAGRFEVQMAMGAAATRDGIASSRREIVARACPSDGADLLLLFDCVSRKQEGAITAPEEARQQQFKGLSGPVFGFYGSGEIGAEAVGASARGVGGHLVAVALTAALDSPALPPPHAR